MPPATSPARMFRRAVSRSIAGVLSGGGDLKGWGGTGAPLPETVAQLGRLQTAERPSGSLWERGHPSLQPERLNTPVYRDLSDKRALSIAGSCLCSWRGIGAFEEQLLYL